VSGHNRRQGVQGSLDARGEQERVQKVTLLHPAGRPDDLASHEQGPGLEGLKDHASLDERTRGFIKSKAVTIPFSSVGFPTAPALP